MIKFLLALLGLACVVSGCGKGNADEVATLRQEVALLRQEVSSLKGWLHDLHRPGRRAFAKDAEKVPAAEVRHSATDDAAAPAAAGSRSPQKQMRRPTREELKARHEAMRDPQKREQLRAEHRARMEERRKRMEERRQQHRESGARPQSDISNSQEKGN